jgi:hypothetical protein
MLREIHLMRKAIFAFLSLLLLCGQSPIGNFPPGVFAGQASRSPSASVAFGLSFIGTASQTAPGGSSCNFGTVTIGSTDPTKKDVLVVGARFTTAATLTSITVGGVTQSVVVDTNSASAADLVITSTANSSGTAANITANYSNTVVRCEVAVYRLVGSTAVISSAGAGVTGTGDNPSKTFTGTSGGGMVAGSITGTAPDTTSTAANMTQDVNNALAATTLFEAGSNTSHAGSSTAYSWQYKVAGTNAVSVAFSAASWASIAP